MKSSQNKKQDLSRRGFLKQAGALTAGVTILPSSVIGGLGYKAPSDKLNIAGIGEGVI